jgi:hypothetical protein
LKLYSISAAARVPKHVLQEHPVVGSGPAGPESDVGGGLPHDMGTPSRSQVIVTPRWARSTRATSPGATSNVARL